MSDASAIQKEARRVLKEAVAEARGTSHVYVYRELVMAQANIPDIEAFARKTGNELLETEKTGGKFVFYLKKS